MASRLSSVVASQEHGLQNYDYVFFQLVSLTQGAPVKQPSWSQRSRANLPDCSRVGVQLRSAFLYINVCRMSLYPSDKNVFSFGVKTPSHSGPVVNIILKGKGVDSPSISFCVAITNPRLSENLCIGHLACSIANTIANSSARGLV